jgi:hypothetical protein
MSTEFSRLLARLRENGGRYLLSVALTSEERAAQPEPTFGGKGHVRWLTDQEFAALCAIGSSFHASAPPGYKCADCSMDDEPCPQCYRARWQKHHSLTHQTATRAELLEDCAALLWDAADMMGDGPDESDVGYAQARMNEAVEKAREIRRMRRLESEPEKRGG